ncbi:MAG: hypothetical protein WDO56_00145 [Gammaproteobacteria bacterium]
MFVGDALFFGASLRFQRAAQTVGVLMLAQAALQFLAVERMTLAQRLLLPFPERFDF